MILKEILSQLSIVHIVFSKKKIVLFESQLLIYSVIKYSVNKLPIS